MALLLTRWQAACAWDRIRVRKYKELVDKGRSERDRGREREGEGEKERK